MEYRGKHIRQQFPILHQKIHGKDLVYLDNAATAQKPSVVLEAMDDYYTKINANIHRGVHQLSQDATDAFELAREKVRAHIGAKLTSEIIVTKGTTEGINLVAYSWGEAFLEEGDEIFITEMDHHSNIVPWQLLAAKKKAVIKYIPLQDDGTLNLTHFRSEISPKTKMVAVNHVSNSLGTINPIEELIAIAHENDAHILIDGAQSVPHMSIDVEALDADFYVFSGHKVFGPTGVGILYGKESLLNQMPPYHGGGEMIKEVKMSGSTWAELPHKFEAGTPNIAEMIGLGVAIDFINELGLQNIHDVEMGLLEYATSELQKIERLKIYGTSESKASVISFLLDGIHPYDVGMILDKLGIAVRAGHHCTQPVMDHFGIPGTVRVSFALYNTVEEVDRLVEGVKRAKSMLS